MFSGVSDNDSPSESQEDQDTSTASVVKSMPKPMPKIKTMKSKPICDSGASDDEWVLRNEAPAAPEPVVARPVDNVPVTGVVMVITYNLPATHATGLKQSFCPPLEFYLPRMPLYFSGAKNCAFSFELKKFSCSNTLEFIA